MDGGRSTKDASPIESRVLGVLFPAVTILRYFAASYLEARLHAGK